MGVDFIGDYDIKPHLGSGADAFHGGLNGVYLDMYPEKSRVAAEPAIGNLWAACEGSGERDKIDPPNPNMCCHENGAEQSG